MTCFFELSEVKDSERERKTEREKEKERAPKTRYSAVNHSEHLFTQYTKVFENVDFFTN